MGGSHHDADHFADNDDDDDDDDGRHDHQHHHRWSSIGGRDYWHSLGSPAHPPLLLLWNLLPTRRLLLSW